MRWSAVAAMATGVGMLAAGLVATWPAPARPGSLSGVVQPVVVREVPTGDTLVVDSPQTGAQVGDLGRITVRLIGVDAPDPGVPNQCYAIPARSGLRALLPPGSIAWVLTDEQPRNDGGMWLAWVWAPDGTFVNTTLAEYGLVRPADPTPNTTYWPAVAQATERASRRNAGLWSECAPGT